MADRPGASDGSHIISSQPTMNLRWVPRRGTCWLQQEWVSVIQSGPRAGEQTSEWRNVPQVPARDDDSSTRMPADDSSSGQGALEARPLRNPVPTGASDILVFVRMGGIVTIYRNNIRVQQGPLEALQAWLSK